MSNTATPATLSNADLKAAQAQRADQSRKAAIKAAKVLLKDAPVHEFQTGSKGRFVRANVEIDGEPVTVQFQIVLRNTVVKAKAAEPAKPARKPRTPKAATPGVSLVKATAPAQP